MEPNNKLSKILIASFLIIAALAISLYATSLRDSSLGQKQKADPNTEALRKLGSNTKESSTPAPVVLPASLPLEKDAEILFDGATNGSVQTSKTYISNLSLEQNVEVFSQYLNKAGYFVLSKNTLKNQTIISAIKGQNNINITIDRNEQLERTTVTITLTALK
ncbi:MAG TPA: hypothetical protein VEA59_06110 [Patescibacteria group bacterium]|nr:hypothetical protein [Patescibacteria group bacterium]